MKTKIKKGPPPARPTLVAGIYRGCERIVDTVNATGEADARYKFRRRYHLVDRVEVISQQKQKQKQRR